jgi:hypothetical protein
MTSESVSDGAPRPDAVEGLREQVGRDRRELAETVGALRDKADVKERVREAATGARTSVTGLAAWAVRTAGSLPALALRVTTAAAGRVSRQLPGSGR